VNAPILVEIAGAVATLTMNRPERLNALDSEAHLALSEALDRLASDDAIRVIVLTGAGERAFSAGRDLKELAGDADAAIAERWSRVTRLTDRFDYPKPIIARVRGMALGGGFELALACDIIVASDDASFALPEPRRGLIPFAGGVHRLPRQLPLKTAMGYLLTGRSISAARAYELGLVNEVVPAGRLDTAIAGWVDDILGCAPLAIHAIRQSVAQGLDKSLSEAMGASCAAEVVRRASRDAIEGPRAFVEKRTPVWNGC
jgi:enoyl-CoA hydratase/carnithine racemase